MIVDEGGRADAKDVALDEPRTDLAAPAIDRDRMGRYGGSIGADDGQESFVIDRCEVCRGVGHDLLSNWWRCKLGWRAHFAIRIDDTWHDPGVRAIRTKCFE